jgi:hypothetical protein
VRRSGRQFAPASGTGDGQTPARSFWLRRRREGYPNRGDMVIRALVRARLLGLQLLTLEARVVVETGNSQRPVAPSLVLSPSARSGRGLQSTSSELAFPEAVTEFARAIELLEQGSDTLERSRRSDFGRFASM